MINFNVIPGRIKSMKLSDYYEYRKCEYYYLQLAVNYDII